MMNTKQNPRGDDLELIVTGEVDGDDGDRLHDELKTAREEGGFKHIYVNLAGIRRLGSTGIMALARHRREQTAQGGTFVVTHLSQEARQALENVSTTVTKLLTGEK